VICPTCKGHHTGLLVCVTCGGRGSVPDSPMQQVRLGRTSSGLPGLFTHGMLALPLTEAEFADANTADGFAALKIRCARMRLELLP
jgi:hypothetical protein